MICDHVPMTKLSETKRLFALTPVSADETPPFPALAAGELLYSFERINLGD